MATISGVITAMVTPFAEDGALDKEGARRVARYLVDNGSHGLVVAVKQANDEELEPIDGLVLLAGNDNVFLRCLELGGAGGVLVGSHLVGAEMRAMYEAATGGDLERARKLDTDLQPIYEATTVTSNPIPVKTALEMLGVIEGHLRLPMVPASREERAAIRAALERHGLLVAGGAR